MTKPVYDVITIADEILKIAKREGEAITPMKLMKLTYIAHGWSLALLKRDLFRNRIEAWQYGPVIPELYHATKVYGRGEIPFSKVNNKIPAVDDEVSALLEDVFANYGRRSAISLSNLTHRQGTPWQQVYHPGIRDIEIPDDLIEQHYSDLLRVRTPA